VFIFKYAHGSWNCWNPVAHLTTADQPFSQFGYSIGLSNGFLAIGAPNYTNSAGAVFIYEEQSNWSLVDILESVTGWNSRFGHSVSLYETTIAVGAVGYIYNTFHSPGMDSVNNTGTVYLFDLGPISAATASANTVHSTNITRKLLSNDTAWTLTQTIESSIGQTGYFGAAIHLFNGSIVIGANGFRKFPLFH
jgi:hypothetical protein